MQKVSSVLNLSSDPGWLTSWCPWFPLWVKIRRWRWAECPHWTCTSSTTAHFLCVWAALGYSCVAVTVFDSQCLCSPIFCLMETTCALKTLIEIERSPPLLRLFSFVCNVSGALTTHKLIVPAVCLGVQSILCSRWWIWPTVFSTAMTEAMVSIISALSKVSPL